MNYPYHSVEDIENAARSLTYQGRFAVKVSGSDDNNLTAALLAGDLAVRLEAWQLMIVRLQDTIYLTQVCPTMMHRAGVMPHTLQSHRKMQ